MEWQGYLISIDELDEELWSGLQFEIANNIELADFDPCCLVAGCHLQSELWSL